MGQNITYNGLKPLHIRQSGTDSLKARKQFRGAQTYCLETASTAAQRREPRWSQAAPRSSEFRRLRQLQSQQGRRPKMGELHKKDSSGVLQRVPLESRRDPPKAAQKIISRTHTVLEILDISTSQSGNPCTSRSIR